MVEHWEPIKRYEYTKAMTLELSWKHGVCVVPHFIENVAQAISALDVKALNLAVRWNDAVEQRLSYLYIILLPDGTVTERAALVGRLLLVSDIRRLRKTFTNNVVIVC